MQMKGLLKPDGVLMANVIDSFKKGGLHAFLYSERWRSVRKGNVHLVTLTSDYAIISGSARLLVVASPAEAENG